MNMLVKISNREKEVLDHMSRGLSSQELAEKLFVSCETIRTHRRNLMLKMDARNVAHLIRLAYESNILLIDGYQREFTQHYAN